MTRDHRLTDRLSTYWDNLRGDELIPDFSQFNTAMVEDVWQQCVLFTVLPSEPGKTPNLSFYKIGEKIQPLCGPELIGQGPEVVAKTMYPTHKHFQTDQVMRKITAIIAKPAPVIDVGQFFNERGKIIKYRYCILPFGRNGVVAHVLAGLSWKEF